MIFLPIRAVQFRAGVFRARAPFSERGERVRCTVGEIFELGHCGHEPVTWRSFGCRQAALRRRNAVSKVDLTGLVHHNDAGSHPVRVHHAPHRRWCGCLRGFGGRLMRRPRGVPDRDLQDWAPSPRARRDVEHVEIETLDWVDWFNDECTPNQSTTWHRSRPRRFTTLQETVWTRPG